MIEPADLEGDVGEREDQREAGDRVAVGHGPPARDRVGQQQRQQRRQGISEQQQVDEAAADIDRPQDRRLQQHQAEQAAEAGEGGEQDRADIVHDAAGGDAQPFQAIAIASATETCRAISVRPALWR